MPVPGRGRGAEAGRSVRTRGSGAGSTLGKTDDSSERDGREGRSAAKKEKRGQGGKGGKQPARDKGAQPTNPQCPPPLYARQGERAKTMFRYLA